jgi:hypothetical protein
MNKNAGKPNVIYIIFISELKLVSGFPVDQAIRLKAPYILYYTYKVKVKLSL